jgi:tetratricopeptide (TPR) repeat protein
LRLAKITIIGAACATIIAFSGCYAIQKKKLPLVKQVYHDITARNNGYFNSDLKLAAVQQNMRAANIDDYTKILPIYIDKNPDLATSYSTDLDLVIKKTSTGIKDHEKSIYADNNYMLLAISYYLKGDFETALETFQYVNTEFKEKPIKKSNSKKKKKKKKPTPSPKNKSSNSKPSSSNDKKKGPPKTAAQLKLEQDKIVEENIKIIEEGGNLETAGDDKKKEDEEYDKDPLWWLKHQPMRPDAKIWIVDSYTALKKYKESEAVLTLIDADEQFPHWLADELELARANHYLQKGDYDKAIQPLQWLTLNIKKKRKKVRYNYILGQIYQMRGDNALAVEHFKKVLKGRPDYRMAFNAKMNMAKIASQDNSMDQKDIVKLLKRMLKENKNADFYDQIYYALAELSLKAGDKDEAIGYLEQSIKVSTTNTNQQALSYLKLAELHYEKEEYVEAQPPYESAAGLVAQEDPNYPNIMGRSDMLKRLVTQINIIEEQDSLIKITLMSPEQREKMIEAILKQKEEEFNKKNDQKNQPIAPVNNKPTAGNDDAGGSKTGDWYFYNSSAKSSGYNDFVKRWGSGRKLEDNWRRSDKSAVFSDNENDSTKIEGPISVDEFDYYGEKEKLMAELPSAESGSKLNSNMVEAYFKLGNIYRYDIYNLPKAAETFEELLKRAPDNKYEVEVLYNLYLIYDKLGNTAKSDYYKNELLTRFPTSKPSMIIKDPKYLEASNQIKLAVDAHYLATFDLYQQNRLEEALTQIHLADSLYAKENYLKPKFDLLNAFIVGQTQDLGEYKKALKDIVKNYPSDEVKSKAEEILSYIEKSEDDLIKHENNLLRYEYDVQSRHFFMVVVQDSSLKVNKISTAIAQYNDVNRSLESLKIDPLILPDGNILMFVKSFESLEIARTYLNAITQSETFNVFPAGALKYLIISDINFNKIIINKEVGTYFEYYDTKYPK